jgi:hypothetical protein
MSQNTRYPNFLPDHCMYIADCALPHYPSHRDFLACPPSVIYPAYLQIPSKRTSSQALPLDTYHYPRGRYQYSSAIHRSTHSFTIPWNTCFVLQPSFSQVISLAHVRLVLSTVSTELSDYTRKFTIAWPLKIHRYTP